MKELIQAVNNVMQKCKNIDKNSIVGVGNSAYKGVTDKDVKNILNDAMAENGLAIFQTSVNATKEVHRFTDQYGKEKFNVFVEVCPNYRLYHSSGQFVDLQGYGHGTDSQDKAAGKATTYALKYTLLYTFMVATGSIDDTDATHSNDIKTPIKQATPTPQKVIKLTIAHAKYKSITEKLAKGETNIDEVKKYFDVSECEEQLKTYVKLGKII
jgi:hypothetical protein